MFGSRYDPDPHVSAKKRGVSLVLGALLVAAAAVLGYFAVARSGWFTQEPAPTGAPFTETTVAPPSAAQPAPPGGASPETSLAPPSTTSAPDASKPPAASAPSPPKPPASSVAVESPPAGRAKSAAKTKEDAAAKATPVAAAGRMLIRSTPAGAQVAVNGVASGVTPLVLRNLPFGSYTIRLTLPGFAPSDHRLVLAPDREAQSVEVALQEGEASAPPVTQSAPTQAQLGSLVVESRPPGATVYMNDRPAGQTPLALANLPVGLRTVRLELAGYKPWSSTVEVTAGTRVRVAASLERVTTQ